MNRFAHVCEFPHFHAVSDDITPNVTEVDYFQTACSMATTSALDVLGKAQSDLDTYLLTLQVMCHWSATAVTGIVRARVSADDTVYTIGHISNEDSVTAHQTLSLNFSPIGLNIGTNSATTAATASCFVDLTGCTATLQVIATGYRKRV